MPYFVHVDCPVQHLAIERAQRSAQSLTSLATALQGWLDAGATKLARRVALVWRTGYRAWAQGRRQALEDERSWHLALQDARTMATIGRAMDAAAARPRA